MRVTLPPLFHIDAKENGNTIQQLAVPSWTGEATVEPFEKGQKRGFVITPEVGPSPVLVITNTAQPSPEFSHALRMRDAKPDLHSNQAFDLTHGKWIKHPDIQSRLTDQTGYERNAASTSDSWHGAFSHK